MTFRPWLALYLTVVTVAAGRSFPAAAAKPANDSFGLVATYSDGKQSIVSVVASPNFVLKEGESIHPQLDPTFAAEWQGFLRVTKKARYTFQIDGSPQSRLVIENHEVGGQSIELDAGDLPLRLTFERKGGAARLQLIWQADFFAPEPVPSSAFRHRQAPPAVEQTAMAERGRLLVEELNCIACHRSESKLLVGRGAPDLSHIGTRTNAAWIYTWLADPKHFRSSAVMPAVPLRDEGRRDIAAYLAARKDPNFKIKEPQNQSQKADLGKTLYETIGCTACHGSESIALVGLGSKYSIGSLMGYLANPTAVDPSGRMPGMLLSKEETGALAQHLVKSRNNDFEVPLPAGADAAHGQKLLQSEGCLNCHRLQLDGGKLLSPDPVSLPLTLENVDPTKGCLADSPAGKAMRYSLAGDQRADIAAFITSSKSHPLVRIAPAYELAVTAAKFRCIACHELDNSKPMDETDRIPPLTGAGSRLRREWIQSVLTQKERSRPWYRKRMPEFGGQNVSHLADEIIAASGAGDADTLPVASKDQAAAGAKLVGTGAGGVGCITCHGFAGSAPAVAADTRGPDLTTAAGRLRADHFRRWVLDPKRVLPATPMPAFFAETPHAQAMTQIETLWQYVSLGKNMPPPVGWIDKNNYTIFVADDPVVMRTNLPGVNGGNIPRGIAVGLPGSVSYVFDADKCQLAYAWTGGFLDMKPSWSGRGGNVVQVLGKRFYENTSRPAHFGDDKHEPITRFRGYELQRGQPVFSYLLDGVNVQEKITFSEKDQQLLHIVTADAIGITVPSGAQLNFGEGKSGYTQTIPVKEAK